MKTALTIALAQLCSGPDLDVNLAQCQTLCAQAVDQGAQLVLFPETAPFVGPSERRSEVIQPLDGAIMEAFREMARRHKVSVVVGSVFETSPVPGKAYNTSVWLDEGGETLAVYRKIHLFDADLPGGGSLRESDSFVPGQEPVCVS